MGKWWERKCQNASNGADDVERGQCGADEGAGRLVPGRMKETADNLSVSSSKGGELVEEVGTLVKLIGGEQS